MNEPAPATSTATAVSPDTEEVRVAATMTGGVSLAIWMGGVAREIDLVMQASDIRRALQTIGPGDPMRSRGPLSGAEAAERDLYARLLELLDIVVEVDVLSGTSAGGINAVLLAYARARGGDLGSMRDIWLDLGAMLDLLRDPTDKDVPSLLYGDRRMFKDLFDKLPTLAPGPASAHPPSTTLYVTTTWLTGECGRFTDALGTLVQDSNKHGLFTFTETDLVSSGIEGALALAGRSTASFPAAFEPSFIPFETPTPPDGDIPVRPAMGRYANITRDHWAVDGGLLDNQPLDVLLERIFDRRARRQVRRVLLFVVPSAGPSPDVMTGHPGDELSAPYGLLEGLLKDLGAATSQSISADLAAIVSHNDRIAARGDLRVQLAATASRLAPERLLTPSLLDEYCTRESQRQARTLVAAMLRLLSTWPAQASPESVGLPADWRRTLAAGGDSEEVCRSAIEGVLAGGWPAAVGPDGAASQDALPSTSETLAEFGQSAFDNAKSLALGILRLAQRAATDGGDRQTLNGLVEKLHGAAGKAVRPRRSDLVESVCRTTATTVLPDGRHCSLAYTAAALASEWADQTSIEPGAWDALGSILVEASGLLVTLAQGAPVGSELTSYVGYLLPGGGPVEAAGAAARLFDLAVAESALLPVDAGPYQPVELVQLSADTRSMLAPGNATAASKLTGLQFHHFGAFYKQSWRANDWMWGRLDAAGWLVHALLDPRRLKQVADRRPQGGRVAWLLGELASFGAVPLPSGPPLAEGMANRERVEAELAFLDETRIPMPKSLPLTSMWLATAWQHRVVEDELPALARVVVGAPGAPTDRSPSPTMTWARKVLEPGADLDVLLRTCPIPQETFKTDMGSPLMVHTLAKAAATTSGAVSSVRQVPGPVRPAVTTMHTITLGGYRVANAAKAKPRHMIVVGLVLLALGIAAASQSASLFGITGLVAAGIGGYLVTFGTWQVSTRLLAALVATTLTGAVAALAAPVVRRGLFGTSETDPGLVGRHVYWLATAWWHPLLAVGVLILFIVVVGLAFGGRRAPKR